jgi:uncharacterized protein YkwD
MRHWILALFLCSIAGCLSSGQFQYDPVDWNSKAPPIPEKPQPTPETHEVPATLQALLKLHNKQRELKGRPGFQLDPYLCQYAQNHSDWMAKKNNLKHSDLSALMGKYTTAGENIALNQRTEIEVVDSWMNSSGHRANIMNRAFTKIGFGVSYNSRGEPYWCTCFGG